MEEAPVQISSRLEATILAAKVKRKNKQLWTLKRAILVANDDVLSVDKQVSHVYSGWNAVHNDDPRSLLEFIVSAKPEQERFT